MRKGAAWDAADQLLPIEQDECELEMVLDDVPPGIMTASTTVACLIMLLMAVLAEFTLLRAAGYSGPAVFFPAAAVLLFIGIPGRSCGPMTILITAMLLGVSYRLAVHGNLVLLVAATWLLAAYTLALRHQSPFFIRTTMFAIESLWGGWEFILAMHAKMTQALVLPHEDRPPSFLFNFGLPLAVLAGFGGTAIALRPDLLQAITSSATSNGSQISSVWQAINSIELLHVGVWLFVMWVTAGLLRPVLNLAVESPAKIDPDEVGSYFAPLFTPLRNTLIAVVVPFALFLVFEIYKQSSQTFGSGFDYSAWTLNGLMWLGITSLGTSVLMCVIFNGATLADSRLSQLRILSYVLVALNFVQAVSVIQRYQTFIHFNGLDQAKAIGLLACVVLCGGLLLTVYMTLQQQNVLWLLRRKTWLVAAAAYLWLVLPVDRIVKHYNVQKIIDGNQGPIVQIARSDFSEESVSALLPLCSVSDQTIREGALAIIADKFQQMQAVMDVRSDMDWTSKQLGAHKAYSDLQHFAASHDLVATTGETREQAASRLRQLAQQWQ